MHNEEKVKKAIDILKKNNQDDILAILKKLEKTDAIKTEKLAEEILELDFEGLENLYKKANSKTITKNQKIEHIKHTDKDKMTYNEKQKYTQIAEKIIKNNEYAVVTMAGGQGTRLGWNGPKGTFQLNVEPEPKLLFQILAENLNSANKKYGIVLNWYIMTSTENRSATEKCFKENNYFGYDKTKVKFFNQGNLPLLFTDGKLVLDKDYSIKLAADGNGCIYKAMKQNGILDDMKQKNIKWVFIGSVDNALLNMVDPILLGLTVANNDKIATKSIAKNSPKERVGAFCKINGVISVIEYSELPEEMAEQVDENGELLYGEAHIMCNLFSIDALEKIANVDLPYHVANKKTNYIDKNGNYVEVTEPNAYKFEAFIFDAFNYFDSITILRGKREEDFAPIKNKEGVDSPETAIKLYNDYWKTKKSK